MTNKRKSRDDDILDESSNSTKCSTINIDTVDKMDNIYFELFTGNDCTLGIMNNNDSNDGRNDFIANSNRNDCNKRDNIEGSCSSSNYDFINDSYNEVVNNYDGNNEFDNNNISSQNINNNYNYNNEYSNDNHDPDRSDFGPCNNGSKNSDNHPGNNNGIVGEKKKNKIKSLKSRELKKNRKNEYKDKKSKHDDQHFRKYSANDMYNDNNCVIDDMSCDIDTDDFKNDDNKDLDSDNDHDDNDGYCNNYENDANDNNRNKIKNDNNKSEISDIKQRKKRKKNPQIEIDVGNTNLNSINDNDHIQKMVLMNNEYYYDKITNVNHYENDDTIKNSIDDDDDIPSPLPYNGHNGENDDIDINKHKKNNDSHKNSKKMKGLIDDKAETRASSYENDLTIHFKPSSSVFSEHSPGKEHSSGKKNSSRSSSSSLNPSNKTFPNTSPPLPLCSVCSLHHKRHLSSPTPPSPTPQNSTHPQNPQNGNSSTPLTRKSPQKLDTSSIIFNTNKKIRIFEDPTPPAKKPAPKKLRQGSNYQAIIDIRISDTRIPDTRTSDNRILDTRIPDTRISNTRIFNTRMSDTMVSDVLRPINTNYNNRDNYVDMSEPHDDICGRLNSSLNVYNDNDSEYNMMKKNGHNDNIYDIKIHENSNNRSDEGFNFVYTNINKDNLNNHHVDSNEIYSTAVSTKETAETLNFIYNNGLVWSPYMNNKGYGGNNNSNRNDGDDNDKYNNDYNDIVNNSNPDKNCDNENDMNIHIHNENKKLNDEKKVNQLNRYVCTALYVLEEYRRKIIHNDNDSHNHNDNYENKSNDNDNDKDSSYGYSNINYNTNDDNHSSIDRRNLHENGRDLQENDRNLFENRKKLHEKNGIKSSSTVIVKCEAMELILETLHHW